MPTLHFRKLAENSRVIRKLATGMVAGRSCMNGWFDQDLGRYCQLVLGAIALLASDWLDGELFFCDPRVGPMARQRAAPRSGRTGGILVAQFVWFLVSVGLCHFLETGLGFHFCERLQLDTVFEEFDDSSPGRAQPSAMPELPAKPSQGCPILPVVWLLVGVGYFSCFHHGDAATKQ